MNQSSVGTRKTDQDSRDNLKQRPYSDAARGAIVSTKAQKKYNELSRDSTCARCMTT